MQYPRRLVARCILYGGIATLVVGCGGNTPSAQPQLRRSPSKNAAQNLQPQPISGSVPCKPHGTSLTMAVRPTLKFTKDCLAAPASQTFTIHLVNNDKVFTGSAQHNVAIYTNPTAIHNVFIGKGIPPGEKVTYHVKALPRGIYYFKCTVHPVMNGSFVSY
jgi:hypothetical protein